MELKIYNKTGNLILTASPNSSSSLTEEIGGECCVSVSFTHTSFVLLDVDNYIEVLGVRYKIKRQYRPKQKNTQTYEYSVKFYAPIHDAEDVLMLFSEGDTTSEFNYDGGPREHLQLWVDNMNRLAGKDVWSIGTVISAENKNIEYKNLNCWDAAYSSNGIAATFETEMWADGFVINLCKASHGERQELGYMQGLTNLSQEDNGEVKFFTRLFPLGSTRNIDASKYGYSRLQLPSRAKYVDKNVDLYGVKEETEEAAFKAIYPKYIGSISSVRTEEKENEEGRKYTVYYFKDNSMSFNPDDYQIPEHTYMLEFQTGELAGRGTDGSFQAAWHENTKEWEIINVYPDDTTQIPGGVIIPKPGDQYIPWNFSLPQEYTTAAEQAYELAVNNFLSNYSFDPAKYTGTTDRNYVERNNTPLRIGQNVRLLSDNYFTDGYKDTRIIKVQRKLNDLYQATITCSDEVGTGWKSSVDNRLNNLQYVLSKQEQQAIIDIIKTTDSKSPSDYNVFSALKAIGMFLRKDKPDSTNFLIKFLGGLISDNIESQGFTGGPFGTGYILKRDAKTGRSYMEIDELYVRLKAYFDTLEIKKLSHVGGRIVLSPASMECNRVEVISGEYENLFDKAGSQLLDAINDPLNASLTGGDMVYRCYFNNTDGEKEITNDFALGDLAQCREFNIKENISHHVSNQYYWRRVVGIGADYIDLSMSDCDPLSMEPKAGDTIVTIGNKIDENRQHVVFLSSYDEDAPCFKLYSGINSYSMFNKEVTVISPNAEKNVFMGRVTIQPGSTGFGNLTDAPDMGLIESEIQTAQKDAEAAKEAITEAKNDVVDLKDYINGAFADDIITEAEAAAIEKYINIIECTSKSVEKAYNELYNNSYLEGSAKVSLSNAYSILENTIVTLTHNIQTAIADGRTTQGEKQAVDDAYNDFNTAYGNFTKSVEYANKSIQDKLKSYADNAQMAADEAKNNATQAMEDVNDAKTAVENLNTYIDGAFSDGIINEAEAKAIEKYINIVTQTKKECDATYEKLYSNTYLIGTAKSNLYSKKSAFNTATSNLILAIQSAIADGKTTSSEKSNVDNKYTAFNTAYANLATAIEDANKSIQDKIKEDAIDESTQNAIDEMNKISDSDKNDMAKKLGYANYTALEDAAKRGETVIQGGMINTKLINAMAIVTSTLIANAIKSKTLNINDKFIIETDGTITSEGQHISKGSRTTLYMDDGFLRMTHDGEEVARLSVNQLTGLPTLVLSYGDKVVSVAPNMLSFIDGSKSIRFDPSQLGTGVIQKRTDGTLYIATQQYNYINISMRASPTEGGRVSPYSGNGFVLEGSSDLVEAIPNSGYEFVKWSDGGAQKHNVVWSDGASLVAYFQKIQYTTYNITVKASPTNGGVVSGGGVKNAGSIGTVSAVANDGYRFVRWSDGGMQSHSVTWDSNKTLTAYFEAYSITGEEILSGTSLTSNSYWNAYGSSSIKSVSSGVATIYMASGSDSNNIVFFNKNHLSGKIEQGHRYKLTISVKASSPTLLSGVFGSSPSNLSYFTFWGTGSNDGAISLSTSYRTYEREFTAYSDSQVGEGLGFLTDANVTIYINKISLKEV